MSEYRVMHINNAYQIQEKAGKGWETIGEFDDINAAKRMVGELRNGGINV